MTTADQYSVTEDEIRFDRSAVEYRRWLKQVADGTDTA